MAITLAQAKETMTDKVDQLVIDEFRRESTLLDKAGVMRGIKVQ